MSRAAARAWLPQMHLDFMRDMPLSRRIGELLFVHARVERGRPFEEQDPKTLMNIREPFLSSPHGLPYLIVHGHVPSAGRPVIAQGLICLDTGAVMTGVLTAAIFDGGEPMRFLQARSALKRSA